MKIFYFKRLFCHNLNQKYIDLFLIQYFSPNVKTKIEKTKMPMFVVLVTQWDPNIQH